MAGTEIGPENPSPFDVEGVITYIDGGEYVIHVISVDPSKISGFETEKTSKENVAKILTLTINTATHEGAAALGVDLESQTGIRESERNLVLVIQLGAKFLDELSPRTDGISWGDWIRKEFPSVLARIHGDDSNAVMYGRQIVAQRLDADW